MLVCRALQVSIAIAGRKENISVMSKRKPPVDDPSVAFTCIDYDMVASIDATHRSTIIVRGDASLTGGMDAYKVYFNGFIHRTGALYREIAPPNSVYTRVPAGEYRVIVREYDHRKADRLETNQLNLSIADEEQITLRVSRRNGKLCLLREEGAEKL